MKKFLILFIFCMIFLSCNTPPEPATDVFQPSLTSPNVKIGEMEIQFNRSFIIPGVRKKEVIVSYYPIEDAVCLEFKIDTITYQQFWTREGRQFFTDALETYKTNYELREFGRSSRRTKRQYGAVNGYVFWKTTNWSRQPNAPTTVEFGYYFINDSPYFTVNQREAFYIDPYSTSDNQKLPETPMYFTRAQADELAALFDQEFLATISLPVTPSRSQQTAGYFDYDEY